jgi:hypothetical protein
MNTPRSTQAKSMHFATLIPDWNSLDSVRRAHSDLEAAALVFFALLVLFDILAHLSTDDKKKTILEKIALSCFAIAVLAEVVAYPYGQRNDTLSGQVIGHLDAETREALIKSGTALAQSKEAETKSGDAIDKAEKAQESLGNAENEAKTAQSAASNALTVSKDANEIAHGARQEADSFEKDIVSAKEQAAKAESDLAGALREARQARFELAKIKTPRSLSAEQQKRIKAKIEAFAGTPFDLFVSPDPDSTALLNVIDPLLRSARWDFKPPDGFFSYGNRAGITSVSGIEIHAPMEHIAEWGPAITTLRDALVTEGISAIAFQDAEDAMPMIKRDRVHVNVGSKPLE